MKLTGELKEKVEKAETKEEAKKIIKEAGEEAGMSLSDEELDQVAGGHLLGHIYLGQALNSQSVTINIDSLDMVVS